MILSANTIRKLRPVEPFCERTLFNGMSYGLSVAGYDIRIAQYHFLAPGEFRLASSLEKFSMPNNVIGFLCDKSTWARLGLSCFNCVLEPGWKGNLTLELKNQGDDYLTIPACSAIAQVIFQYTDEITAGYSGKYQNQGVFPQPAILE